MKEQKSAMMLVENLRKQLNEKVYDFVIAKLLLFGIMFDRITVQ